jgi:hypothetical protein
MHDYDGVSEHLTLGDSPSWPFFLEWYASMQIQRRPPGPTVRPNIRSGHRTTSSFVPSSGATAPHFESWCDLMLKTYTAAVIESSGERNEAHCGVAYPSTCHVVSCRVAQLAAVKMRS